MTKQSEIIDSDSLQESWASLRDNDMRLDALKMAWDGVGPKIFNPDTKDDVEPRALMELYEIAEYNYRFIKAKDLAIDMRNAGEKTLQYREDRLRKIMQKLS
jgi:hypothetical protein